MKTNQTWTTHLDLLADVQLEELWYIVTTAVAPFYTEGRRCCVASRKRAEQHQEQNGHPTHAQKPLVRGIGFFPLKKKDYLD